jgi:Caspase domain
MAYFGRARRVVLAALAALAAAATSAQAQQMNIAAGQTVQGSLAEGDSRLSQQEYADPYTFRGRAGQVVTVRMRSSAFDAYVMMMGPGDFNQQNDDEAAPATDAGLTVTLPRDGDYTIFATSLLGNQTGAYTLQVSAGGNAPQQAVAAGGPIQIGQSVRGALAAGDQQLESGEFADTFTLAAERGQTLVIEMASTDFDPYLIVRGPGGLSEDNDDGDQGSLNSRVRVTVPASGQITIRPTSFASGQTGAYTLSVRAESAGAQAAASSPAPASSGAISVGQRVNAALANGDGLLNSGELRDVYTLRGRRGQQLEVRMNSAEFDPYVAIFGPGDFTSFNDDDAENNSTNSRMLVTLPADGDYQIMATSYAAGERGSYSLSVLETNDVDPGQGVGASADRLRIGRSVNGTLAAGDSTLRSGEFTDTYRFQGEAGQRIRIEMSSQAFDSYVVLVAPSGAQEENDDGPAGVGDSVLETQLAESGEYALIATSFQPGESGAYTLRVNAASAGVAQAPTGARGRVFALMVGISDYQGTANNLAYTDEDAVKMAESLRRAGVLADQSVVLTNAQATIAGVRAAFQRVAAQAGPNDTFLFFYSGHGTQTRSTPSASEPDGKEEAIVMVDGLISDDEMATMFRQVRAGTSIIALDACFSGGFSRDVVSIPGVMGLFSSEEDLTSAVADKFEAGGYLSLFLRNGLGGEADANRNGALTAGELSVYLRQQFAANAQNVESTTMEGARNYQFLVVDRGGVGVDDQVLRLGT